MNPIFILGILERSGTNFLQDLLLLHPDCGAPAPIWEDYLIAYADLLDRYVNFVYRLWEPAWGVDENHKDSLCKCIGNGIISFLSSRTDKERLITKTPTVRSLRHVCRFFPEAHLIILIRDGRAVVESGVKSLGWDYEAGIRSWAEAADTILSFEKEPQKSSSFKSLIVRYEDLNTNIKGELLRIFKFLELDAEKYDFSAAESIPVRGSSEFRGGKKAVHWEPVKRTAEFNPLLRWSHWDRGMHERFNWIAGEYMAEFGYEEKQYKNYRLLWALWNKILDIKWRLRTSRKSWKVGREVKTNG